MQNHPSDPSDDNPRFKVVICHGQVRLPECGGFNPSFKKVAREGHHTSVGWDIESAITKCEDPCSHPRIIHWSLITDYLFFFSSNPQAAWVISPTVDLSSASTSCSSFRSFLRFGLWWMKKGSTMIGMWNPWVKRNGTLEIMYPPCRWSMQWTSRFICQTIFPEDTTLCNPSLI